MKRIRRFYGRIFAKDELLFRENLWTSPGAGSQRMLEDNKKELSIHLIRKDFEAAKYRAHLRVLFELCSASPQHKRENGTITNAVSK